MSSKKYTYLALGDSYTIGEAVAPGENFPNQVYKIFNQTREMASPMIIAKTGWTTDELNDAIDIAFAKEVFTGEYDFVTLLIGVNNQYRGRTAGEYEEQFENLLQRAVQFAGGRPKRVIVLSIPDWGITPFAADRDRQQIKNEIDAYNKINRDLAENYFVHYLDITTWTREAAANLSLLTNDGLHPSGIEYQRWAEKLAAIMAAEIIK